MGVKGVDLREGDEVIDLLLVTDDDIILTITKNGHAQRTHVNEYRKTGRATKGVINISLQEDDGDDDLDVAPGDYHEGDGWTDEDVERMREEAADPELLIPFALPIARQKE